MRRTIREVEFRPFDEDDEAFVIALGRRSFSAWSRNPGQSLLGMARSDRAVCELASVKGEPVGLYVVTTRTLDRPFGPLKNPAAAHLDAIAVVPRVAGRGVGRALLLRAERVARSKGAVVMSLMTAVGNERAQALFNRAGYLRAMTSPSAYANAEDAFELFKPL